jgi:hypothetical protein
VEGLIVPIPVEYNKKTIGLMIIIALIIGMFTIFELQPLVNAKPEHIITYEEYEKILSESYSKVFHTKEIIVEIDITENIGTYLIVKHYDGEGNLKGEFKKKDDLMLENLVNLTANWFSVDWEDARFHVTDDTGASGSPKEVNQQDSYIAIGNGTTAPTFTDIQLENELYRETIDDVLIEDANPSYNLTFTSFYVFDGIYNVSECGLLYYEDDLSDDVFLTRDIFSVFLTAEYDTISISIIIEFNNIARQMGEAFANCFAETDAIADSTYDMYSLNDATFFSESQFSGLGRVPQSTYYGKVLVGTGTGAFNILDYELDNQVMEDDIDESDMIIYQRTGNDVNITMVGFFSPSSTYALNEVGYAPRTWWYDGSNRVHNTLMIRKIISTLNVNSGDNFAVYIVLMYDQ